MLLESFSVLLVLNILNANAANILVLSTLPSYSHHIWNNGIASSLAKRDHNVTIVTSTTYSAKSTLDGVHHIYVGKMNVGYEGYVSKIYESKEEPNAFVEFYHAMMVGAYFCEDLLKSDAFHALNSYPDDFKFDLVIYDLTAGPCFLPFLHKFKYPPMIAVTAFTNPSFITSFMGGNHYYSYVPHTFLPFSQNMTFWQRVQNFAMHIEELYVREYAQQGHISELVNKYFGPEIPPLAELEQRACVALVNTVSAMDYRIPLPENVIPIAGVHIKDAKPLPKDLDEFLNSSKKGVVMFSMGTIIRSKYMPIEKQKLFINVFGELKDYHFLWKFESNFTAADLPKNVQIRPWLPQSDILAHPKLKAFITHGGLLSTQEAIWRGVPLIVFPFAFDQHMNLMKVKHIGIAEGLDFFSLTPDQIRQTLLQVLEDPKYAANAKRASIRFRDQKETPSERAVWWIEWVLRNPDCDYLKSPVPRLGYIVGNSLDVIAFVTLVVTAIFVIVLTVLVWCCKKVLGTKSSGNKHHKKEE